MTFFVVDLPSRSALSMPRHQWPGNSPKLLLLENQILETARHGLRPICICLMGRRVRAPGTGRLSPLDLGTPGSFFSVQACPASPLPSNFLQLTHSWQLPFRCSDGSTNDLP